MVLSVNEQTFKEEVLESAVPVILDFWAPWCGLCRVIHPLLRQFQMDWSDRVKVVRVNADNNLKLANTYQLKSLPTLLIFENGKVIHRLEGFHGRDDLRLTLEKLTAICLPNSA